MPPVKEVLAAAAPSARIVRCSQASSRLWRTGAGGRQSALRLGRPTGSSQAKKKCRTRIRQSHQSLRSDRGFWHKQSEFGHPAQGRQGSAVAQFSRRISLHFVPSSKSPKPQRADLHHSFVAAVCAESALPAAVPENHPHTFAKLTYTASHHVVQFHEFQF